MDSWLDYKKQIERINIYDLLDECFKENQVQNEVIRLNQEQLYSGIDAQGKIIHTIGGNPYRLKTIHVKRKKGQKTNVVTLRDTGEFYNTFRVNITNNGYEVIADFEKEDGSILDNFTSEFDFMGLTDESLAELVETQILYFLDKFLRRDLGI
jgi:hypothetical protein